jgi:SAM-dependent methyltransferase
MTKPTQEIAAAYDEYYRRNNYFNYRSWLYRPFIKSVIGKARLTRGNSVLDVGCGQGFFSSLFADEGLVTLGVDLSPEGINSATSTYGRPGLRFEVANIHSFPCHELFDCVFSRSCSLYNITDIEKDRTTTDTLLSFVRPGGVLIFDYHTNFCTRRKNPHWIHHSLPAIRKHFSPYPRAQVFFTARLAPIVARHFAFSSLFTAADSMLSTTVGIGGEVVAFVRRESKS